MDPEVISALIGFAGVVVTALLARAKVKSSTRKLKQAESELTLQQQALDFGAFVEEWGETYQEIDRLMDSTTIDRFLILRAWNGHLSPRWTTAVFQMRKGMQMPVSYVHFELDTDYVSRLKEISVRNVIAFNVDEIPEDSAIRAVYEAEKVTAAVWVHIMSEEVPGTDTVAHTYASFATRAPEKINKDTVTKCSVVAGRLRGIASTFKMKGASCSR
ncbi:MAG: hypothetical protein R3352_05300 [Salinisphaeraceae bacterium]|nr:hypothetical protein [Salinisphaeraceae bacterium]